MDENISAFFELVRAGLWEKDISLYKYSKVDYDSIRELAEAQSVMGLITAGLEHVVDNKLPQTTVLEFIGSTLQIEQRNKEMNAFLTSLVTKMRNRGIYTLLVKGQGVAQCYERPLWRTSGDIDFFLSNDNYEKAKNYLLTLASSAEKEKKHTKHIGMAISSWEVEIHGTLRCGLSSRINRVLDNIQHDAFYGGNVRSISLDKTNIFLLSVENDIIYTFAHFFSHFYGGGIGLRQICDWCRLLWVSRNSIDSQKLESMIKSAGIVSAWRAFGAFAVEYLGMPPSAVPLYSNSTKWKRRAKRICSFIIKVGNFGHNRDNTYYGKYPYFIRKLISSWRRFSDLSSHFFILPMDSLYFFPQMLFNGLRSAVRGE